jgi:energy-coupling factor transporter ATP-binding protein EcfA2
MSAPAGFPRHLLKRPEEERLAYFRDHTAAHAVLREVDDALMSAIEQPSGASLIFVFGPTGVGKTTLLLHIQKRLIEASQRDHQEDKSRIPVASMEAVAPENGNFNWKEYYQRALMAVSEPLADRKVDYLARITRKGSNGQLLLRAKPATSELRLALEDALRYRRLRAFIVDEAQHLTKMASGRKLQDQLDSIKSLANMGDTVHVLVGTYELLAFRNLSGQLSRRSADIHFRRYRADSADDIRAYRSVLWDFQRHMPLPQEPDLLQHWQYCYERTIGCVGILKTWLMRSFAEALQSGSSTITLQCLEKHALSISRCVRMTTETIEGEEALSEKEEGLRKLHDLLGVRDSGQHSAGSDTPKPRFPKPVPHRAGQRNPYRDPVGVSPYAAQ